MEVEFVRTSKAAVLTALEGYAVLYYSKGL
jgi:hypothetical protein